MDEKLTPEEFAEKIVSDLLPDLPIARQNAVREAIEHYASEWGLLVSSVEAESYRDCY